MFTSVIELIAIVFFIILRSTVYATLLLLVFFLFSKKNKNVALAKIMEHKMKFWLTIHFMISLSLFIYKFSYWQDTGLGEYTIIPIGYKQRVENIDTQSTYFYPDLNKTDPNKDGIIIENYSIIDPYLCAEVSHESSENPKYDFIVYNLVEKKLETFKNKIEYKAYAKVKKLPNTHEFYSFEKHYYEFIDQKSELEQWLLP